MAIEKREKKSTGRRKAYSYRVKWRYGGTGPQQGRTVDTEAEAVALEDALRKVGWAHMSSDPEVKYLTILGGTAREDVSVPAPATATPTSALTLGDAVQRWGTRPGLSKSSQRIYKQVHSRLGAIGEVRLDEVDAEELSAWFRRQGEVLSSNTMNVVRIAVRGATVANGRPDLTADLAKVAARRKVVPVYLEPSQLDALVAKAESKVDANFALLVRLTGTMGPRWGEGVALQPRHMHVANLDQAYFWVREALKNDGRLMNGFKPEAVKTAQSERMVPLAHDLAERMAAAIEPLSASEPIFKPRNAGFWNQRTFAYQWRRLAEACPEVPDQMRWHDLRHTAAKNMLERGVPIAYVSKILGHSKIDVTQKEYGAFDQRSHDLVRGLMM